MADILSSFSLLLTIITMLFGLWYKDIVDAVNVWDKLPPTQRKDDRTDFINKKKRVQKTRILPLLLGYFALVAVLAPEIYKIIIQAIAIMRIHKWASIGCYNSVKAILFLVFLFALILLAYLLWACLRLRRKIGTATGKGVP